MFSTSSPNIFVSYRSHMAILTDERRSPFVLWVAFLWWLVMSSTFSCSCGHSYIFIGEISAQFPSHLFCYYFFPFIFSRRLITLQYCSGFCHTLKWISHGFTCAPHPNPPSRLPPTPSPWVFPVHQPWALVSCIQPGLAICFTLDNIHVSMLFSQNIPPWFYFWVRKIPWRRVRLPTPVFLGFPCDSAGKESTCNPGDLGSIPGSGRSPGEGKA